MQKNDLEESRLDLEEMHLKYLEIWSDQYDIVSFALWINYLLHIVDIMENWFYYDNWFFSPEI